MTYLHLKTDKLPALVAELNTLLANYTVYHQKLLRFHWNVRGENFFELHEVFEKLYQSPALKIDAIAERIQTLKYRPLSMLHQYLEKATIKEKDTFRNDREMVQEVLEDQSILIKNLKDAIQVAKITEDDATIYLLSSFLLELEKNSWMLYTWLSKPVSSNLNEVVAMQ